MPSTTRRTVKPQIPLAVMIGASGTAKLAGVKFTRDNFARWGYADWWRPAIGAVEVATALAALAGLKSHSARQLAAAGALSSMGGAIATHEIAGDAKYNHVIAGTVAALGAATLFDLTLGRGAAQAE
jgi:hypothetical protein